MKLYYAWPRGALTETHWPGQEGPLPSRHDAELALVQSLAGDGGEVVTASQRSGRYSPNLVQRRAKDCDAAIVTDYLARVPEKLAREIQLLLTRPDPAVPDHLVEGTLPVFLLRHDLQGGEVDGKLVFAGTGADTLALVDDLDLDDTATPQLYWAVVRTRGEAFPATAADFAKALVQARGY